MNPCRRFHFDIGDSTKGPVGYCAVVWARSFIEARDILVEALENGVSGDVGEGDEDTPGLDYLNYYTNATFVTWEAVDTIEDEEGSDCSGEFCDACGASLNDGEGYDGKCGNCADKREAARA